MVNAYLVVSPLARRLFQHDRSGEYSTRPVSEALVQAAGNGDLKGVQALLDGGVSPNAVAPRVGTEGESALEAAAGAGHTHVVKLLLDRGADVNAPSPWGATAITGAASCGFPETVRLLISRGADVNSNDDGATPLGYARNEMRDSTGEKREQYRQVVALLRAAGAMESPFPW
jgi:hypothetical protein